MQETFEDQRLVDPARGRLREARARGRTESVRLRPPRELAAHVHHFWSMKWTLSRPLPAEGLLYPTVRIVFVQTADAWRAEVTGPRTERLVRQLDGEGQVFGVAFRPAAFAPLLEGRVVRLADRVLPIGAVFGAAGEAWAASMRAEPDVARRVALAVGFLAPRLAPLPADVEGIRDVVERMARDRSLRRLEDVCEVSGSDARTLQRGFRRYLGVSPKWVLQGFRMHEAVERLKQPEPPALAELAATLGYADQAHFSRDFKRRVGETPRRFVERNPRGPARRCERTLATAWLM